MADKNEASLEIQLKNTAGLLISRAEGMIINSPESQRDANTFLLSCSSMQKRIKAYWEEMKETAHKASRGICDKEAEMLRIPDRAKGIIENKLRDYRDEERRRAAEEQRKAEETRRKEEERMRAAELKKAEKALDRGNEAKAEEHLQRADEIFVPPVEVQPTVAKTDRTDVGAVTGVLDITIEVTDQRAVAEAVNNGNLPEHILDVKLAQVKTWAKGNGIKNMVRYGLRITEFERYTARETRAK